MKKEYKYFGAILSVFLFAILTLSLLFRKYSLLTFQHFIETCRQILPTFFSSGVHFVGLALVALTSLVTIIFFAKTIFSLVKTQRKIDSLLKYKLDYVPNKLNKILAKLRLHENFVFVVNKNTKHAFSFGLKSNKIVISKGLIDQLSLSQLEAVILHEKYHIENKHPLLLVVSEILSSTLFFLPMMKEVSRKMRAILEREADLFAQSIQGSDAHLKVALSKVPNSRIQFYPQLAMRKPYELSKNSIYGSVIMVFILLSLLLLPVGTHASEPTIQAGGDECTQTQCSTHCPTDNMSKETVMSSNLQHNLSSVAY